MRPEGKIAPVTAGRGGNGRAICARLETEVREGQGRIDIPGNGSGIEIGKTIEDTALEEWSRSLAVNVTGSFPAARRALPLLREAATTTQSASIISSGTYDGFIADPGLAACCAAQGAVRALTRAMACGHGPEGIRVNAICPGHVDTPMPQGFRAGSGGDGRRFDVLQKAVRGVHPVRRCGTPEDVANLVTWLAPDEARHASGQLSVLDGGLSAQGQQMRL